MARTKRKSSTKRTKSRKTGAVPFGFSKGKKAKRGAKNIFGGKPKGPASKKKRGATKGKRPMVSTRGPITAGY